MSEETDNRKIALEHSTAWFVLHATQRLQSVNYYLVAVAFLSAAFVTAAKERLHELAGGVSVLAIAVSYFFFRMDRRIRDILHDTETALCALQSQLSGVVGLEEMKICERTEHPKPGAWKYSKVFRWLYGTTALMFALGLLYVAWDAYSSVPDMNPIRYVLHALVIVALLSFGYELLSTVPPKASDSALRAAFLLLGTGSCLLGLYLAYHLVVFVLHSDKS